MPTTTEVRPVRPPSEMPVEDSTKVVTVEVPRQAPTQVAHASAISALSPLGQVAVLIQHAGIAGGADECTDGIEAVARC